MRKSILLISMLAMFGCQPSEMATNNHPDEHIDIVLTRNEMTMVKQGNDFGINLFRQISMEEAGENVFVSPLSASLALSMATNGAASETLAEMKKTLGFEGYTLDEMNTFYRKLVQGFQQVDPEIKPGIANSIWIHEGFPVLKTFKEVNAEIYDAEVRNLDFFSPGAKDIINNWCEEKTNGRIKEMVSQINPNNRLFLINALYFKGDWKYQFAKEATSKAGFTNADGKTAQVDMMHAECAVGYAESDDLQIAELPYGEGAFSMVIVLPKGDNSPQKIIEGLTGETWNLWMENLQVETLLNIQLPKFKQEYERTMNDDLIAMGMQSAFSESAADFSNMSKDPLFISLVKQKSFVEVSEEGTEAAAVTIIGMDTTAYDPSIPRAIPFLVNRPFIYAIKEKDSGVILFMGKVEGM